MTEFELGYMTALRDINEPMSVIQKNWQPSECPRCNKSFSDYEPCNDGYYKRAYSMERCPFCGQKIVWHTIDCDFSKEFDTWILAFCPDTDSWFATNKRYFYYEFIKEFPDEKSAIEYFKQNAKIFLSEEERMEVYRPSFYYGGVYLENTKELVPINKGN